jgi:hypothetical protein
MVPLPPTPAHEMARAADVVQLPCRGWRAPEHAGAHTVGIEAQDVTDRPEGHRPALGIVLEPGARLCGQSAGRGAALQIEHGLRQDGAAEPLLGLPAARRPRAFGIGRIIRDGGTDWDRADPAITSSRRSANRRHTCHGDGSYQTAKERRRVVA